MANKDCTKCIHNAVCKTAESCDGYVPGCKHFMEEKKRFLLKENGDLIPLEQEWISVKDRLPDEDGKYLVFEQSNGRTNTSILRFAKDARKVDRYDFKGRWKNAWYEYDSEWGHYTVDSVTHWMPLPQPPKGEINEYH